MKENFIWENQKIGEGNGEDIWSRKLMVTLTNRPTDQPTLNTVQSTFSKVRKQKAQICNESAIWTLALLKRKSKSTSPQTLLEAQEPVWWCWHFPETPENPGSYFSLFERAYFYSKLQRWQYDILRIDGHNMFMQNLSVQCSKAWAPPYVDIDRYVQSQVLLTGKCSINGWLKITWSVERLPWK